MPNDDLIWAAFASYVYLNRKQAMEVLGCKRDYIQVRLRKLYYAGYLDRQQESKFAEFVYFLTEKGGNLAASRGHLNSPRWIQKKSKMTLAHDVEISDFHARLDSALRAQSQTLVWKQWRGDLAQEFGEYIPDATFWIHDGRANETHVLEIVKSYESGYKGQESSLVTKLKTYEADHRKVLVVMPTVLRIQNFLGKIENELPSSRLWFTSEERYKADILGKIWWTPRSFRERVYSLLRPEAS
jgi:hypothetical protein